MTLLRSCVYKLAGEFADLGLDQIGASRYGLGESECWSAAWVFILQSWAEGQWLCRGMFLTKVEVEPCRNSSSGGSKQTYYHFYLISLKPDIGGWENILHMSCDKNMEVKYYTRKWRIVASRSAHCIFQPGMMFPWGYMTHPFQNFKKLPHCGDCWLFTKNHFPTLPGFPSWMWFPGSHVVRCDHETGFVQWCVSRSDVSFQAKALFCCWLCADDCKTLMVAGGMCWNEPRSLNHNVEESH